MNLGQYEIHEMIGSGGMGSVYRAWQVTLHRQVAVKILSDTLAENPIYLARFNREAQTAAALHHPNIITIYDFGTQQNTSYVVMEFLTGGSLGQRLQAAEQGDHPLPSPGEVAELLRQIGSALDYAHNEGVIHRDVKPSNIMFDPSGRALLVDFGIAKLTEATTSLTSTGMSMGSPSYMPPEQWRGEDLTAAADQYALAMVAYVLLTGRLPFEGSTPYALMHKHINEMPTAVHILRPEMPQALTQALERALAKDPAARYPSCTAFAQAFAAAIEGKEGRPTGFFTFKLRQPAPGSRPHPPQTPSGSSGLRPAPPFYRRPLMVSAALLVIALSVALGMLLASGGGEIPSPDLTETNTAPVQTMTTEVETNSPPATPTPPVIVIMPSETATPTDTPTPSPSETNTPTDTSTPAPSETTAPTYTPIPSETDTPTDTPTSPPSETWTSSPTLTVTPSTTPNPTETPTATFTAAPTPTATLPTAVTTDLPSTLHIGASVGMRAEAGGEIVRWIAAGDYPLLTASQVEGEVYYQIQAGDQTGWIRATRWVTLQADEASEQPPSLRISASVGLRDTVDGDIARFIPAAVYPIVAVEAFAGETYYQILVDNHLGWIRDTAFVEVIGSLDSVPVTDVTQNSTLIVHASVGMRGELDGSITAWVDVGTYPILESRAVDGEIYYQVLTANGTGWIRATTWVEVLGNTENTPDPSESATPSLRVRSSVGIWDAVGGDILRFIPPGTYPILARSEFGGDVYYQIRIETLSGWIRANQFVEVAGNLESVPLIAADLNALLHIHASVGMREIVGGEISRWVSTGTYPILAWSEFEGEPYYRIRTSGAEGWIRDTGSVRLEGTLAAVPFIETDILPVAIVTADSANLRSGPGTDYAVIATVDRGTLLKLLARSDNVQALWYLVRQPNGQTAWVWSALVRVTPSDAELSPASVAD